MGRRQNKWRLTYRCSSHAKRHRAYNIVAHSHLWSFPSASKYIKYVMRINEAIHAQKYRHRLYAYTSSLAWPAYND